MLGPWLRRQAGWLPWAVVTTVLVLGFSGFFSGGQMVPTTTDLNQGNYRALRFLFPPDGIFSLWYWLGLPELPNGLTPLSVWAWAPEWLFFTTTYGLALGACVAAGYALGRELGFRRVESGLLGVMWAWQGEAGSTVLAGHFPHVMMWAVFPLAAWFQVRAARTGSWRAAVGAGAAVGVLVALLPDRGMLCSFLIGGMSLVEWARRRRESTKALALAVGRFGLMVAVAVAIALPAITATFSTTVTNVMASVGKDPAAKWDWATQWSFPPEEMAGQVVPGLFGWYTLHEETPYWGRVGRDLAWERNRREGMREFNLAAFSTGTAAALLIMAGYAALARRRHDGAEANDGGGEAAPDRGYAQYFAVAGVVAMVLAFGKYTPLFAIFHKLPFMDTWRNPLKFLMPAALAWVVVGAWGAAFLRNRLDAASEPGPRRLVPGRWMAGLALGLGLVWLGSWPAGSRLAAGLAEIGYSPNQAAGVLSGLRWAVAAAAVVAGLMAWMWRYLILTGLPKRRFLNPWLRTAWHELSQPDRRGIVFLLLAGALQVAQMGWVVSHYYRWSDASLISMLPVELERYRPTEEDPYRFSVDISDPVLRRLLTVAFPANGIYSLDIPAASRIPNDYDAWFQALNPDPARRFLLAGVRYVLMPERAAPKALDVPESPLKRDTALRFSLAPYAPLYPRGYVFAEAKDYLAKATLVPGTEVLKDDKTVLRRLTDRGWDPRRTLLLDAATAKAAGAAASPAAGPAAGTARVTRYDEQGITVEIQSPEPAWLMINDRFDPWWAATLNGQSVPILRANFIMRAVRVPAGSSRLEMRFRAPSWPVYIQLATWGFVAVAGLTARRRKSAAAVSNPKASRGAVAGTLAGE